MLKVLILAIIIVGFSFAGFAIKMFFKKDGRFEKHCGSVDPLTGKNRPCLCHGEGDEACIKKTG